ncbi:MAG: Ig-like domain-containing protein [Pseudomonadota bacterium]|uniref:Ig-like domain-containing protein n=1 Tax=Gallaecimonas pentaromativorans TaxID=584787 RepID=UPI00067F3379|nr:Ig-like domain-containing protein [Gallaecimonas pentaromativorans]MED5526592.1 Ig-like domain-containing protein [Pseudomonadota bacterium]
MIKKTSLALFAATLLSGCGSSSDDTSTSPEAPANQAPQFTSTTLESINGVAVPVTLNDLAKDPDGDTLSLVKITAPQHGSLKLVNDTLNYQPAAGFIGSDSAELTLTDGQAQTTATLNLQSFAQVTLSGQVVDDPIPGATVTAKLDGNTFSAKADNQGNYQLLIKSLSNNDFVTLTATGDASQGMGAVKLVSLLGEMAGLVGKAGEDAVLDADEDSATQVTNLSTAYYLLQKEAKGSEPASDADIATYAPAISPEKMLEVAAVIKLILDDSNYSLPQGFSDVLAFTADIAAYNSFVTSLTAANPDDNALTQMVNTIKADPALAPKFSADPLPGSYYTLSSAIPGYLAVGADKLSFNADGTGTMASQSDVIAFNWHIDSGQLIVNPTETTTSDYDATLLLDYDQAALYAKTYGTNTIKVTRQITSLIIKLLADGSANKLVSVDMVYNDLIGDFTLDGQTINIDKLNQHLQYLTALVDAKATTLNFDADDIAGTWALPTTYQPANLYYPPNLLNDDILTLNADGTGYAKLADAAVSWTLDAGKLNLHFADGRYETVTLAAKADQLQAGAVELFDANQQLQGFDYDYIVKQSPDIAFTPAQLVVPENQYWVSLLSAWDSQCWHDGNYDYSYCGDFGWEFFADGTGNNLYHDVDYDTGALTPVRQESTWQIAEDGSLDFTRKISDSLTEQRQWLPLAFQQDGLMIAFESASRPDGNGGTYSLIEPRINLYRLWPLPESSQTAATRIQAIHPKQ